MKGVPVAIIFVIVNIIALTIFSIVATTSIKSSIVKEERASREALINIINIYNKKNTISLEYLKSVSLIPKIDTYTILSLSNYINKATRIEADNTLIEKPLTFKEYQYMQARIQEKIDQINDTARNYPVLRTNQNYIKVRTVMAPIEKEEKAAINVYNTHIKEYNKLATTPPSSIVAGIMGKFPFLTFQTGTNITAQTSYIFE